MVFLLSPPLFKLSSVFDRLGDEIFDNEGQQAVHSSIPIRTTKLQWVGLFLRIYIHAPVAVTLFAAMCFVWEFVFVYQCGFN